VEDDAAHVTILEGFMVPKPEILPIPKQAAELDRAGTVKGFKDRLDILALLMHVDIDWDNYKALVKKYSLNNYRDRLVEIMEAAGREFEELGIRNPRRVKQIKGRILAEFSS
jgi:hypothetical protein